MMLQYHIWKIHEENGATWVSEMYVIQKPIFYLLIPTLSYETLLRLLEYLIKKFNILSLLLPTVWPKYERAIYYVPKVGGKNVK